MRSNPATGPRNFARSSSFLGLDPGPVFGSLGLTGGWRDGLHSLRHPGGHGELRAVGRAAQGLASHRIGAHPEQVEQVLFADRRTLLDPSAVVEGAQPGAEEHSRGGTRLGVVIGQARRLATNSIARGHGLHQVAIPRPQTHPAQRNHVAVPFPGRHSSRSHGWTGDHDRPPGCQTCEAMRMVLEVRSNEWLEVRSNGWCWRCEAMRMVLEVRRMEVLEVR